jgi:hypothetical protein
VLRWAARGCPAVIVLMVVVLCMVGIMTRTVRHRHSRAGRI